MIAVE